MQRKLLLGSAALLLAACGQSDREAIVADCAENDHTLTFCQCLTDAMYERLLPRADEGNRERRSNR